MTNAIIGGGAAGIFAALRCKAQDPKQNVIVLEKTNQLLSKVRISGGGRCNVTHACFDPKLLAQNYPRGHRELIGPFHTFQAKDTVEWFQSRGVELKAEADGRMFPVTDSSETIIQCLLEEAQKLGVEIRKQQKIEAIEPGYKIRLADGYLEAKNILLATGSSPWGHEIARLFGHTIIEPVPSLFTFNTPTSPLLDLSGISVLNAIVSLPELKMKYQGPLLLTHWGFSGPAVLKLSAWAARELHEKNYKTTVLINWTASENQEALYQTLLKAKQQDPSKPIFPFVANNLLQRLLGSNATTPLGKLSNPTLMQMAAKLSSDPYLIDGKTTYKQEFVTAGGVDLKQIDFKRMESRLAKGLFFAGEILNIDGITGGFNFQNAWTTGWLAGTAMATT